MLFWLTNTLGGASHVKRACADHVRVKKYKTLTNSKLNTVKVRTKELALVQAMKSTKMYRKQEKNSSPLSKMSKY